MRALFATVVALATLAGSAYAADLAEIKARGSLRIVAAAGEQPEMFSFTPDADPGFEREMLEGFARLHDLKVEIVRVDGFSDRIPAIVGGRGDVVVGMIATEQRREHIEFTDEVLPARHLVVTHEPNPAIDNVAEFLHKKVGVLKGTTWSQAAAAAGMPESKCTLFTDTEPLLSALEAGEIEATVMSVSDFTLAAKRRPGMLGGVFVGDVAVAAWGVHKEATELTAALNAYLVNLHRGAGWNRLVVKYFGEKALTVLGREDD